MNHQLSLSLRVIYPVILAGGDQTLQEGVLHLDLLTVIYLYFHVLTVVKSVMLVCMFTIFTLTHQILRAIFHR